MDIDVAVGDAIEGADVCVVEEAGIRAVLAAGVSAGRGGVCASLIADVCAVEESAVEEAGVCAVLAAGVCASGADPAIGVVGVCAMLTAGVRRRRGGGGGGGVPLGGVCAATSA